VENLLILNEIRLVSGREKIVRIEVKDSKVMMTRGGDYLLIGDRFPRLTSTNPQSSLAELLSLLTRLS
jgi:transcription-repair coupling factor (superfamily II helicase)